MNARKDQRKSHTILSGERRVVVLSKFGRENMKIDLENGRTAKSEELEVRMNRFMGWMKPTVRPEELKFDVKAFFKTYASFHLVTARGDGSKSICPCPTYH